MRERERERERESPPPRLLLTSGMIWTTYNWLNKFYSCYMVMVAIIVNGRGLDINRRHGNLPNKIKLALYKALLIHCSRH